MTSQLRSETARINGAKSHGPKTSEGKEKSSRNALKHGLTSRHTLLLACEDPAELQKVIDEYEATYQPETAMERNLVEEMVGAKWRIRRLKIIEIALTDYEMARTESDVEEKLARFDSGIHLAVSYQNLADESRAAALLARNESRLHRIHQRAHQTFLDLRRAVSTGLLKPAKPEAAEPPTPKPEPEKSKKEPGHPPSNLRQMPPVPNPDPELTPQSSDDTFGEDLGEAFPQTES